MAKRKNPHAVALGRKGGKVISAAKALASRANGKKGGRPRLAPVLLAALLLTGCALDVQPRAILRDPVSGQTVDCTFMSEVNTPVSSFPVYGSAGRAMGAGMADGLASAFREQDCVNSYAERTV